jgi:hypothetical protein
MSEPTTSPFPSTIAELLSMSKKCYNYSKYTPKEWEKIARHLAKRFSIKLAYVMLDSKHMRWCEHNTYKGFRQYLVEQTSEHNVNFEKELNSMAEDYNIS